ncbi:MAG: N-acetylmuramoyl-L-alanine amidase [Spirochaetia bacterium]|nr:N-acetylmuramoyl-L-alanine amidase [Spirochaetia bacterium]
MKTNNMLLAALLLLPASLFAAQSTIPPVTDLQTTAGVVVVIDPAHGGGDRGVNVKGINEKDITLKAAKYLKAGMEKAGKDVTVILTRNADTTVSPEDRVGRANNHRADIYISIHCDYSVNESDSGFRLCYYGGEKIFGGKPQQAVEWSTVPLYHLDESVKLAGFVERYLTATLIPESNSVDGGDKNDTLPLGKRSPLALAHLSLAGTDMPAVVIELGNMNNRDDMNYLRDDRMLSRIMYHIKEGLVRYLKEGL